MSSVQVDKRRPFGAVGGFIGGGGGGGGTGPRDPLLQPFASTSPWLTGIGSGAILVDSGLGPSGDPQLKTDSIFVGMSTSDPLLTLDDTNFVAGVDKGAVNLVPPGTQVHVPAGISHSGTMNGIYAFLDADGRTVWQGMPLYLRDGSISSADDTGAKAGPRAHFLYPRVPNVADVYGDGIAGSHGGSHLGGLGGCLRAWEWNGAGDIEHALALNVTSWLYLSQGGTPAGYRWPATRHDSGITVQGDGHGGGGGNNYYGGSIPDMRMGSLLCLPASFDLTTVTDPQAARIAWTLQNYGAYVVDATGVNEFYSISADATIVAAISAAGSAFHAQALALMPLLKVVSNNTPTTVGGGGTPRRPPLPDIAP